ncbi:SDR family oxidoreductase [Candidatus Zixiibacteriota bacterium]
MTGAAGLLGQKVVETAVARGFTVFGFDVVGSTGIAERPIEALDITSAPDVMEQIGLCAPDWIVNTAAYTAVDESEDDSRRVHDVNVGGVENLLVASSVHKSRLLVLSTDYVFDGEDGPYEEDDQRNPLGTYGVSKAAMEDAVRNDGGPHLIARTMVLFGAAPGVRRNFGLWVLQNLLEGETIRTVTDQMGNPTLASDLAGMLIGMMLQGGSGTYHVAGSDRISRYQFAVALALTFGLNENLIQPVSTDELGQSASRPLESGFTLSKLRADFGIEPLSLTASLESFRKEVELHGDGR